MIGTRASCKTGERTTTTKEPDVAASTDHSSSWMLVLFIVSIPIVHIRWIKAKYFYSFLAFNLRGEAGPLHGGWGVSDG